MVLYVAVGSSVVAVSSLSALIALGVGIVAALALIAYMLSGGDWLFKHGDTEVQRIEKDATIAA
jgi:hypothetical protein